MLWPVEKNNNNNKKLCNTFYCEMNYFYGSVTTWKNNKRQIEGWRRGPKGEPYTSESVL